MRFEVLWVVGLAFIAGCYQPTVANGGYACSTEHPECPSGFTCVAQRCVKSGEAPPPGADLSSGVGGVGGPDMTMSSGPGADMTTNSSSPDMAKPPMSPDMATPIPQCLDPGAVCMNASDCCSNSCTSALWPLPIPPFYCD
jgi:hypothetical protein